MEFIILAVTAPVVGTAAYVINRIALQKEIVRLKAEGRYIA